LPKKKLTFDHTSLGKWKLVPRLAALRAYLVANGDDYMVMQGGLTRSSAVKGRFEVSHQHGGCSKDTWIVSDTEIAQKEIRIEMPKESVHHHTSLPSRSAENLFGLVVMQSELCRLPNISSC
jgi:hypothetical protein